MGAYISYKCCLFMRAYLFYGTPCLHTRTPKIKNVAYQVSASVEEVRSIELGDNNTRIRVLFTILVYY
jgi:hypothetical protein